MRKLFIQNLKNSLNTIIIITVILLVCAYANGIDGYLWHNNYYNYDTPNAEPFGLISILAGALATLVPILVFRYKMRKINIDQLYSLPIKREKLFITKYLVGLVLIFVPITIMTLYCFFDIILSKHMFDMKYYFPYYFSMIGTTLIIYNICAFMFTRANTVNDGIINIIFGIFFLSILDAIYAQIFPEKNNLFYSINTVGATLMNPLASITDWFASRLSYEGLVQHNEHTGLFFMKAEHILWIVVYGILAVSSFVLSIILIKKDKSEDSMGISNSIFSYKVMIPYYLFGIAFFLAGSRFIVFLFILIGGYLMYIIYRRTYKIKKVDIICLFASVAAGLMLGALFA